MVLGHLHPHTCKHPFSLNLAEGERESCCAPVLMSILPLLKSLFYYGFGHVVTITRPDVKIKWSWTVFKGSFMRFMGGDNDH
jgi:hypothetical protein